MKKRRRYKDYWEAANDPAFLALDHWKIGFNIRRLREERGISRSRMRELYECSEESRIAQLESGQGGIGPGPTAKLMSIFNVEESEFYLTPDQVRSREIGTSVFTAQDQIQDGNTFQLFLDRLKKLVVLMHNDPRRELISTLDGIIAGYGKTLYKNNQKLRNRKKVISIVEETSRKKYGSK